MCINRQKGKYGISCFQSFFQIIVYGKYMAFCNVDTKTKYKHRYMYTQTNLTNLYIVYHVFVLLTALQFVYDKAQIQRVLVHDIE